MSDVRIIEKATCPTLTGKSNVSYHWGSGSEGDLLLRISGNTGGGYFSQEWVPLEAIRKALAKQPENLSAVALFPLFRGKSVNTPGYLLAVLKHEKLVEPVKGKQRRFQLAGDDVFEEKVRQLQPTIAKKAPAKKKRAPRAKPNAASQ
jgi:hypothetical protein